MMKEVYSSMGIQTDSQIPQHTLKIERTSEYPAKHFPENSKHVVNENFINK